MLTTLDAIGLKYGTDKASKQHDYLRFYERFFAPSRDMPLKILEIGVYGGASLKVWKEYFSNATIVGVDINPSMRMHKEDRVYIEILDQSNIEELTHLALMHGPFDIIIEDGSHRWDHQITSLRSLFPYLKNGGFYIVEDLHSNYGDGSEDFRGAASETCVHYLKQWADLCCGDDRHDLTVIEDAFLQTYGRSAALICFSKRCCLIEKGYKQQERTINVGAPLEDWPPSGHVFIKAHLAGIGDVVSDTGYINLDGETHLIQGLSIDCDQELEYSVSNRSGTWSPWLKNGEFAGTRGLGLALKGFRFRSPPAAKGGLTPVATCRFTGNQRVNCQSDETCSPQIEGLLCGIHIGLFADGASR